MQNPNEILFQIDDADFADVMAATEPGIFPDNTEVNFRFVGFRADKDGKTLRHYKKWEKELPYIMLTLEPFGNPQGENFKEVDYFVSLPFAPEKGNAEQEKAANRSRVGYKRMFEAFGVTPTNSLSESLLMGKQVKAIVGVDSDEKYGDRNTIKKFIIPGQSPFGGNGSTDAATKTMFS